MIKLRNGLLVEPRGGRVVIRGELEPETLSSLKIEWYQRGLVSQTKIKDMMQGIEADSSNIPDLTLGMRGTNFTITNNDVVLHDDTYIIDGLQRWTAGILLTEKSPPFFPYLGVKAFTLSDINFELKMFRELNSKRTAMAASVLLRNEKEYSRVAATLFGLGGDKKFAMCDRIAWEQRVDTRFGGQLLRGITLLDILMSLHRHVPSWSRERGSVLRRLYSVEKVIGSVGLQQARENLITFFDAVDEAWGIRDSQIKYSETFITPGWLIALAIVFSDHREFWRENAVLYIPRDLQRDLKKLRWSDQKLNMLARGNQSGRDELVRQFVDMLNKGKTTNRLVDRYTRERAELEVERRQYYGSEERTL